MRAPFSSRVRVELLTHFFSHPEHCYARSRSREIDENNDAVWQELNNLEGIGLLASEQEGNIKDYRLIPDCPIFEELRRIAFKDCGLGQALREGLGDLDAVKWAFVHGSAAAGDEDVLADMDLMLVGQVDLLALSEVIARQEEHLAREINSLALTQAELAQRPTGSDPFTRNALQGPKVMLVGDQDAL